MLFSILQTTDIIYYLFFDIIINIIIVGCLCSKYFFDTSTITFLSYLQWPLCSSLKIIRYTANIEEKDITQAIRDCAEMLVHVHISENDRSTPGSGNVRWEENFKALKEVDYDGWMMVEAFGLALPELAAATKIWRRMYKSEQQLAQDAITFMKENVAKHWG